MDSFPGASYYTDMRNWYLYVIIHLDIGFYIKEFNHDNAKKGAICCA